MLNQVKNALEAIIQLPADIDKDAKERQVGVDFVRDEQIVDFESRAKSTQIKNFLKKHRQQVAYQALPTPTSTRATPTSDPASNIFSPKGPNTRKPTDSCAGCATS